MVRTYVQSVVCSVMRRVESIGGNEMLAQPFGAFEFGLVKPTISHQIVGISPFSMENFGKRNVGQHNTGKLLHEMLYIRQPNDKQFGEGGL